MAPIQHIAGEPTSDGIQYCTRCGQVVVDNRGAMVEIGSGSPGFFESGAIYNQGNMWCVVEIKGFAECQREGTA